MQKILVIGCSGAGKSTLAKQLSGKLHIEVIHLDALFWNSGWVQTSKEEWRERIDQLCKKEQWIMDGNYGRTLSMRLQVADTVILFDYPRLLCLWGAFKRRFMYAGKTRPDMAIGCPEKVDAEFLKWIWNFNNNEKPQIMQLLSNFKGQVYILKSRKDAEKLIDEVKGNG
jgi:adenylate kinase family enzyme